MALERPWEFATFEGHGTWGPTEGEYLCSSAAAPLRSFKSVAAPQRRLRYEELLDAAHIIGDTEPDGEPVIPNGLALCKLHHAAYDRHFLTVTPAYVIEVRPSLLAEEDGPMLLHGLKEMHGREIYLPHHREHHPDRGRLERRYRRLGRPGSAAAAPSPLPQPKPEFAAISSSSQVIWALFSASPERNALLESSEIDDRSPARASPPPRNRRKYGEFWAPLLSSLT
jgi:hypothetical protein